MSCPHCVGAAEVFDQAQARKDLRRLRRRGPSRSTRRLLEGVKARGVRGATVLDVGGGVGALQLGFLDAGAARALNVDASPAYQQVAREEAVARGLGKRLDFLSGDMVEVAPDVEPHDVVTLDRVLCCYPDMEALVDATTSRARRLWGAVLPRERWTTRAGVVLVNLIQRIRGNPFRAYLHPPDAVRARVVSAGFHPVRESRTFLWHIWLFQRDGTGTSSG